MFSLVTFVFFNLAVGISAHKDSWEYALPKPSLKRDELAADYQYNICHRALLLIVEGIKKKEPWALSWLDVQGKPVPGLLRGASRWPGDLEGCLHLAAPTNLSIQESNSPGFQGRYCTASLTTYWGTQVHTISLGVCLPDICQPKDSKAIFHDIQQESPPGWSILNSVLLLSLRCPPLDDLNSASCCPLAISFFLLLVVLVIIGTAADMMSRQKKATRGKDELPLSEMTNRSDPELKIPGTSPVPLEILRCFSAAIHLPNLFKPFPTSRDGPATVLSALNGMRTLATLWLIWGNAHLLAYPVIDNIVDAKEKLMESTWAEPLLLQSLLGVEVFFTLSGFLLAFNFLKNDARKSKKEWATFYANRLFRLAPTLLVMLLIFSSLSKLVKRHVHHMEYLPLLECPSFWWDLFYLGNLDIPLTCMKWTWALAIDMQLFVFSPAILVPLSRRPRLGLFIVAVVGLINWIVTAGVSYQMNLDPLLFNISRVPQDRMLEYMHKQFHTVSLYIQPCSHLVPFLAGIVTGHFVHRHQGPLLHLKKLQVWSGWLLAAGCFVFVFFGTHLPKVVIITFQSSAWSVFIGWVLFACISGYAKHLNDFLSSPVWVPLSHLGYCVILLHPLILMSYFYTLQRGFVYSHFTMFLLYCGFLVTIYAAAFVVYLLVEAPGRGLRKLLLTKPPTKML